MNELDITNDMLATMGIAPLLELSEDNPDVAGCRRIIKQSSQKLQSEGWWFNKEKIDLFPDVAHFIYIPNDAIDVKPVVRPPLGNVTIRDRRLYDRDTNDYLFYKKVECEIVREIPLDDLPLQARIVIGLASVVKYQQSYDADRSKTEMLTMEYREALGNLRATHTREVDANLLRNSDIARTIFGIRGSNRARFY